MWGGGQWPLYFFFNVDYDALHFHKGVVKSQHFQSTLLGGRGVPKKYDFDNVDNSGRPLRKKIISKVENNI